jgi:hypothetical protein
MDHAACHVILTQPLVGHPNPDRTLTATPAMVIMILPSSKCVHVGPGPLSERPDANLLHLNMLQACAVSNLRLFSGAASEGFRPLLNRGNYASEQQNMPYQ